MDTMGDDIDLRDDIVLLALDLARDDDPERILAAVETIRARLGVFVAAIWLYDAQKRSLKLRNASGLLEESTIGWELPVNAVGTSSEVLLSQRVFVTERFDEWMLKEPGVMPSLLDQFDRSGTVAPGNESVVNRRPPTTLVGVPLWADGRLIGLLGLLDRAGSPLVHSDHKQLVRLGELVGISLARAIAFENFTQVAFGDNVVGYGADLTRLLERQRAVIAANARSEEYVRRHLAEDLHDASNQLAAAIQLKLQTLELMVAPAAESREKACIEGIGQLVQMITDENRKLIEVLDPSRLKKQGLVCALRAWAAQTSEIVVFESVGPERRISADAELGMFRIACEAALNALRHGDPEHICVDLDWNDERLVLSVVDDGCGFDVFETESANERMGLTNMRGRAFAMGADIRIASTPGKGTKVTVELELGAGKNRA